jgi:hypothetical protein
MGVLYLFYWHSVIISKPVQASRTHYVITHTLYVIIAFVTVFPQKRRLSHRYSQLCRFTVTPALDMRLSSGPFPWATFLADHKYPRSTSYHDITAVPIWKPSLENWRLKVFLKRRCLPKQLDLINIQIII